MRAGVWIRTLDSWAKFQFQARRYWWLWLVLLLVSQFVSARLSTATDWIVAQMNAPNIIADALRQLVAPAGLAFIVVIALGVHAYWDTRPNRSRSGSQISDTGSILPPPETAPMASDALIAAAGSFTRQTIYLTDLVRGVRPPVIRDRTFEDCEILGPVIVNLDACLLQDCGFELSPESGLFPIAGRRAIIGGMQVASCVFRRCTFKGVGFMGSQHQIDQILRGIGGHVSPAIGPVVAKKRGGDAK